MVNSSTGKETKILSYILGVLSTSSKTNTVAIGAGCGSVLIIIAIFIAIILIIRYGITEKKISTTVTTVTIVN